MSQKQHGGVALPQGHSGSSFFHHTLSEAIAAFPDVFGDVRLPSGKAFKKRFPEAVTRFEAARAGSARRAEIATFLADKTQAQLDFVREDTRLPLATYLEQVAPTSDPGAPQTLAFTGKAGWVPEVPFRGHTYKGAEVRDLVALLESEHQLSAPAAAGLRWILDHADANGGAVDLTGHRFAMLGAGAELAPTDLLLRAGATVLWIDLADPTESLARRTSVEALAGSVQTAPQARDLLTETAAVANAVARFAEQGPVHLGLFAYAPGRGRELRLAGAMEGVARYLPPGSVKSLGMYISPTAPAAVQPGELGSAAARSASQPAWQKALCRTRVLTTPGHLGNVAASTVPLQGPGYLAAQYLSKVMMAERWATLGGQPVDVSANVAGITNTRSLHHPLFQIAFAGAPTMGVQIFETETTRPLSALLWLRDLLDPQAPGAAGRSYANVNARAEGALSQQIHGGVFSLPWVFWSAIRIATMVGVTRRPDLLLKR